MHKISEQLFDAIFKMHQKKTLSVEQSCRFDLTETKWTWYSTANVKMVVDLIDFAHYLQVSHKLYSERKPVVDGYV